MIVLRTEKSPMVCYSTGAIESLIRMLSLPVFKNHPIRNELLPDLESLRRFAVDRFVEGRATDEQIKVWMKQVREMIYDIQDWLDTPRGGGGYGWTDPGQPTNKGISKIDEKQIEDFKDQILEARERCTRYGLLDKVPISDAYHSDAEPSKAAATPDPGSLSNEKIILVGLDGPKIELDGHLKDERKKQKVVSVFGMEGLGKTTLAMEIYEKLKGRFEFQTFISVGQNPNMRTILLEIRRQLHQTTCMACSVDEGKCDWLYSNEHGTDQQLITNIWEVLSLKRYFVFIDDIHSAWAWRVIYAALPNNNLGSRILTTTRSKDVALLCSRRPSDVVYQMKPLGDGDSRRLLFMTTSVKKEERPIDFEEVCNKLSQMCGGMPLAIIVFSGLLTWKSFEVGPSKVLGKYMLRLLDQYSTSEGMRKILEICFSDLTLPMRSCFLYLSAFPANFTIMKDCLIWRWAAEGLLPRDKKGEDYFKELITRRLIQPVFDDDDDQEVGCTVQGVIHEFITSLSSKENFVTEGAMLTSESFSCDTIRRFSVDCNKQDAALILKSTTLQLLQMRSLTLSKGIKNVPDLSAFKLLRVLDIEVHLLANECIEHYMEGQPYLGIETVQSQSMLEYLGLRGYGYIRIRGEIGQGTKWGHTINVSGKWRSIHVASPKFGSLTLTTTHTDDILAPVGVKKLASLLADDVDVFLEHGRVGAMQELEELSTVNVKGNNSINAVSDIVCNSKNLSMFGLRFSRASASEIHRGGMIHFLEVLAVSSLQSLFLEFDSCFTLLDLLLQYWTPKGLEHLRKFVLRITRGSLQEIPQEIASLVQLTHLHIAVRKVDAEGIGILGNLPNLVLFDIRNSGFKERCFINKGAFRCLTVFWFECSGSSGGMWLQLNEGAMPQLRKVRIRLRASEMRYCSGDLDFGIQHLCSLVEVRAIVDCSTATASEVDSIEAAIIELISEIPRDILLEFSREFGHPTMVKERKPGGEKEEGKLGGQEEEGSPGGEEEEECLDW